MMCNVFEIIFIPIIFIYGLIKLLFPWNSIKTALQMIQFSFINVANDIWQPGRYGPWYHGSPSAIQYSIAQLIEPE